MANTMSGRGARGSNIGKGAPTPNAVKAQGDKPFEVKVPTVAKAKNEIIIPKIAKGALSKDVGPVVIKQLATAWDDDVKIEQMKVGSEKMKYSALAALTQACVKAARADDSIDLTATTKSGPDGQKAMGVLNDQLGLALGFREVVTVGEGDKAKQRIIWAAAVKQYFPVSGEDKGLPEVKRKDTFRGNFMTQLKKAAMTALGIVDRDIEVKMDTKAGTLSLSGPEIKKQFGAPSVLLNEKQTVQNSKGDDVKLAEKPSFTAIAAKAAEAHGKHVNRSSNTRGAATQSLTNPGLALDGICTSMIQALDRLKEPSKGQIESVKKVESAIDVWLSNNEKD